MDDWARLKELLAVMNEYVCNGFIFPEETFHEFLQIKNRIMKEKGPYCPTCGSCGEESCCPPSRCKFGLSYIANLQKELQMTRKALAKYIEKAGYKATEDIIDQEIEHYGR